MVAVMASSVAVLVVGETIEYVQFILSIISKIHVLLSLRYPTTSSINVSI